MTAKEPICPHCGAEYNIDKNESYHLYRADDIEELTCGECKEVFFVKVIIKYTFKTEKELGDF